MAHPMTLDERKQHVSVLASVEQTGARFMSAYFAVAECWSVGQLRRPSANGPTQVNDYAVYAGRVVASKAGAGP